MAEVDGRFYAEAKLKKDVQEELDARKADADKEASDKYDAKEADKAVGTSKAPAVDKEQHPYAQEPSLAEGVKANANKK